jgi:preprotein translocase subunit SecY
MKNLLTIVLVILGFLFIGFVEEWRVEIGIEENYQVLIGLFYWTGALVINFKDILSAFKNPSIFIQLITSYTVLFLLFFAGVFFIYFMSPEGDYLNKGEDGKGSWNLWTGLFLWLLSGVLLFFKKRFSEVDFDNDPVLNKLDKEMEEIARSQVPRFKQLKKEDPALFKRMQQMGIIGKEFGKKKK